MTQWTPIEGYGLIGNLETCGLVGVDGSVDWFPFPHVESPTVLAAILDPDRGGRFRIGPAGPFDSEQRYVGETNVLETTFRTDDGAATVTDFMPPAGRIDHPAKVLYRKVTCTEGEITLDVEYAPRFDYARADPDIEATESGVRAEGGDEQTLLETGAPVEIVDGRVTGTLTLGEGDVEWFLLRCTGAEDADTDPEAALTDTIRYWREWAHTCGDGGCVFDSPWHDLAVRSGLALKLLTHETGAIAAAPTASLPEDVGGVRNWDYRFNWLRDAGFTVQSLMNLGHVEEATAYFDWFMELCHVDDPGKLQPLYGLHGDTDLSERELDHLSGYRDSRPVRIGNGAADQRQLDIYGELVLAVDEMLCHDSSFGDDDWEAIRAIVDYVRENWTERDAGIWEVRGGNEHFVYSKVMCWVALDRGINVATEHGFDAPVDEWRDARETIRADILENGYDEAAGSFVQAYGSDSIDATGLLIPIVGFLPFDDERVRNTIDTVEDRLLVDDVLVRRYDGDDGLPGEEGAFTLCACWLVDALALSGRVEEARERFDALTDYVSPTGLIAEELDTETGTQLGNYPQAFSHIGLVNSTLYLGYVDGGSQPGPPPMGIRLGDPIGPAFE
jgi:GH15 family glucan-1,4-alpha-glucosidase